MTNLLRTGLTSPIRRQKFQLTDIYNSGSSLKVSCRQCVDLLTNLLTYDFRSCNCGFWLVVSSVWSVEYTREFLPLCFTDTLTPINTTSGTFSKDNMVLILWITPYVPLESGVKKEERVTMWGGVGTTGGTLREEDLERTRSRNRLKRLRSSERSL